MDDEKDVTSTGIAIVDEETLRGKIYVIRGQKVMLDSDLAEIYGYTVSAFNQQVKRNIDRFPDDFMFQLTKNEVPDSLKSQFVILNVNGNKRGMHVKKMPCAFTEQGIYMLMTVPKGDLAIEQSKALIRLFKSMKDYLVENQMLLLQKGCYTLLDKVSEHSRQIQEAAQSIKELREQMVTRDELSDLVKLFDQGTDSGELLILDGQPFTADEAYQRIYEKAERSIIVIDDYIGIKTLHHLAHAADDVKITVISNNRARPQLKRSEYNDYQAENPKQSIEFLRSKGRVHDRYILLDEGTETMSVYHCGTSSKDAGRRITTITRVMDIEPYKGMITSLLQGPKLVLK